MNTEENYNEDVNVEETAVEQTENLTEEPKAVPAQDNRRSINLVFRGIAGAYLIYMAVNMLKDMMREGTLKWQFTLFAVIFIVCGVFFLAQAIREYGKKSAAAKKADEESSEPDITNQTPAAQAVKEPKVREITGGSIRERLRQMNEEEGVIEEASADDGSIEEAKVEEEN